MPITYQTNVSLSAEELAALFVKSGIHRPTDNLERLQQMIDKATLTITAWDGEALVGVARALTDFCYCCYLSDLAVDRAYQGQGIGRALAQHIRDAIGEQTTLVLVSAPDAMSFYPKIGMDPLHTGWIIRRTK